MLCGDRDLNVSDVEENQDGGVIRVRMEVIRVRGSERQKGRMYMNGWEG